MVLHTYANSAFLLGADDELCQGEDGACPALKRLMKNYMLLCRLLSTTISPLLQLFYHNLYKKNMQRLQ